ncbi:hypothetical protein OIU85_000630 [Salix viminalis]|uniref:Condensation domain-containing protein n=1 Tax=Salix viminalis TaxID=40686 RepID=A0A9Q0VKN5_SALVM|nr:hypothetical protein OIU85_000630 [Salix viminalis]
MSSQRLTSPGTVEPKGRAVGGTEQSWCRAVPGGTGIAVLAILTTRFPRNSVLENALHKLQKSHPILRSRLHTGSSSTNTFSFITSPTPFIKLKAFSLSSTFEILENPSNPKNHSVSPLHLILEHELNQNSWCNNNRAPSSKNDIDQDMFFATIYALPNAKWVLVLRLHASACDRTTAVSLLRELVALVSEEVRGAAPPKEIADEGEVCLSIEDLVPDKKVKKGLWERGIDMLGYSVNSLRLTNLRFKDSRSPRSSQVVRLQMNQQDTEKIIAGCKSRGIKLCGALTSAGIIAAHKSKNRVDKQRKYAVVTLTDCRSILEPSLSNHHFGFYHSAILNTHVMKGGEKLWELAQKVYAAFASYKNCNRHFSDMADLNFLMCKAIDNPGLTPSSSLRTALLSVFEESVTDNHAAMQKEVGVEDYMGCAAAHGIGPSIAIFDTIRDGRLDCVCVYPSPLHSREQMQEFIDNMKSVLVEGCGGDVV